MALYLDLVGPLDCQPPCSLPVKELTFTFQILFSVFVGLQGTLLFLLHGIRNKDAHTHWKLCFGLRKSRLSSITSTTKKSSAGPQNLHGNGSTSCTLTLTQRKDLHTINDAVDHGNKYNIYTSVDTENNMEETERR